MISVKIVEALDIELTARCNNCLGEKIFVDGAGREHACHVCGGDGEVLTELGKEVVRVVRRHVVGVHEDEALR